MRRIGTVLALVATGALAACGGGRALPALDRDAGAGGAVFHFVSDRAIDTGPDGALRFTTRRDPAMSYGVAVSGSGGERARLRGARTRVRFPATPLPFDMRGGQPVTEPEAARAYGQSAAAMRADLARALRDSGQRDILLYVHGFSSRFAETMETLGRLWRASGRGPVPVAFSWPAGNAGLFAYFKDRESGDFSVLHLKNTLRLLASVSGLRRIHLVAHSRGTGVATTALREMVIAARAAGHDPRQRLKVENLFLAAPDLDFSVVGQRLIGERFGPAFGRITVYINPGDGALGVAQILLAGVRFGRISFDDLSAVEREIFEAVRNVDFINVSGVVGRSSHSYFRNNPQVLADMAEVIATGAPPDSPTRSLDPDAGNFWRLVQPRPGPAIPEGPDR